MASALRPQEPLTCAARTALGASVFALVAGCGDPAPVEEGYGADPLLPEPETKLIPTVNVADADRWEPRETPSAAASPQPKKGPGFVEPCRAATRARCPARCPARCR